jgi:hypothetical protein
MRHHPNSPSSPDPSFLQLLRLINSTPLPITAKQRWEQQQQQQQQQQWYQHWRNHPTRRPNQMGVHLVRYYTSGGHRPWDMEMLEPKT